MSTVTEYIVDDRKWLRIKDAAKMAGVTSQRISQLVAQDVLRKYEVSGVPFVSRADVVRYMRDRRGPGRPPKT